MRGKIRNFSFFGGVLFLVCVIHFWPCIRDFVKSEEKTGNTISVGFAQVGAESDWRTANSVSMKETFTSEKGYDLIFEDANQIQKNQVLAIRSFIQQGVDYIVLCPVTEEGWDIVLGEAKDAGIPVIIMDRQVKVKDPDLYTTWVGPNTRLEGDKLCQWLHYYFTSQGKEQVNIVHIQGTIGSTAQIGRTDALTAACELYGWNLLAQQNGEFTQAKAQEVMEDYLKIYDDIDLVYCENDNEAYGAIETIETAGKRVGVDGDIQVVSFDATHTGLEYLLEGKILANAECNPLLAPKVEEIIRNMENGIMPEKQEYIEESLFVGADGTDKVVVNGKVYPVINFTKEMLEEREY